MKIEIEKVTSWERVVDGARMTIHRGRLGKEPSDKFCVGILHAEHSPIRLMEFDVRMYGVPYFVAMHLVRHNQGVEKFVATSREDRTGVPRTERKQTDLVDCQFSLNAQAFINISRKRLCNCADKDTIKVWKAVVEELRKVEPMVADCCVRECVYRGRCPEIDCCGYYKTDKFKEEVEQYWSVIGR